MKSSDIIKVLPHRYPFLLVDRVLSVTDGPQKGSRVGHSATVRKNVTINEPFFTGHFPEFPIMPGVLLVEAMAQAAALAYYRDGDEDTDFMIAGLNDGRFRRPVTPGDTLQITSTIVKDRKSMIQANCKAEVDGQVVAEATILAALAPRSESRMR